MIELGLETLKNDLDKDNLETSFLTKEMGAYQFYNDSSDTNKLTFTHDKSLIHFIFSLQGKMKVFAAMNDEIAHINGSNFYVYSNPYAETVLNIELEPSAKVMTLVISIKALHGIFGSSFGRDAEATKEFMMSYKMKKFFIEKEITPSISVLVHRFFSGVKRANLQNIYQQGKVMELLSLYMDAPNSEQEAVDACPFTMDALELKRIQEARDIIIKNMISPPSLKSLAKLVGTNEYKLKFGFKSVYSNTVFGYLLDYRMELARKLLTVDNSRIKDVAAQIGYSNPSHFIAVYKRKYGVTPKQHLLSSVG